VGLVVGTEEDGDCVGDVEGDELIGAAVGAQVTSASQQDR